MIRNNDGKIEFKYSLTKLLIRMALCLVLVYAGVTLLDVFANFLFEYRLDSFLDSIEAGMPAPAQTPIWAIVIQVSLIAVTITGVLLTFSTAVYLISRKRVFMNVNSHGVTFFKLKAQIGKLPQIIEIAFLWKDFEGMTLKKRKLFGKMFLLGNAYIKDFNPSKNFEFPIRYSEDSAEDIFAAVKERMKGR